MEFDSLESCISYIKSCMAAAAPIVGEEMKEIMKQAIETDIYSAHGNTTGTRTGALGNCAEITEASMNGVTTEYMDNGGWSSAITGEGFFPLEGFLGGSVWAPGGGYYSADPASTAFNECLDRIPEEYRRILAGMGVPIE